VNVTEAGPEEVRRVARALNAMARELDARIDELAREGALREQILSAMTEGVLLAEPSGGIVYANPAAHQMLGATATMPSSLAADGIHEITLHHPHRRELRAATVRMTDGRTLVALQDVTESKRVEAMRRDFVADASHELKTPVAAILASAETLQHAMLEDPESAKRFAARLESDARRLADLVTELLDLSRFEKGPPEAQRVDVSALVGAEADAARPAATAKGLGFASDVAGGVYVNGDRDEIAQAVRNVVENAIRYTDDGDVAVRLTTNDARALIEVRDTGVGIPSKDLPRVFERFYRVDRARSRATGGTGLGLSIVKHVAERHGGDVRAHSRLGEGSVFTIELPLAQQ
jgi:signal transduction histidine kinase